MGLVAVGGKLRTLQQMGELISPPTTKLSADIRRV